MRRPAEGAKGVHNGWSRGCRGVRIGFRAPRAHLGLGGDEHVLRARHERRLELGPELGLDVAAHRAAWGLCGLEAIGVRDEREQEHGGTEHCHQTAMSLRTNTAPWHKTIHKKTALSRRKGWQKTYNSPFASAELDILRRRFTFSFVARNMLLVPSLIGSAFMPGASLSLGRSTVSAPAPVVMAVAPKKIAVGVIGTGLVGAELLEQAAPAPAASSPPPSPAAPPPPPPPPSKPTAHLLACPPLFTTTAGVVQGGAAEAGAGHHGGVDLEDQGQRRR